MAAVLAFCAPARARERGAAVRVTGVEDARLERGLRSVLPRRAGPELVREMALSYLQNQGYLAAEASVSGSTAAAVELSVAPGPRWTFGPTVIRGLQKFPEDRLRLDLPYAEGAPYERSRLLDAQRRLYSLGLFDDVRVTASTSAARAAEVTVSVKERPMKWVRAGAGYGTEEKERLSLILTHNNLFRRGYTLEGAVQYSRVWLDYRGSFINRHVFGSSVEQRADASWRRENRRGYDLERMLGQYGLAKGLPWRARVEARYKLEQVLLYNLSPEIDVDLNNSRPATSSLGLTLSRDSTDDPFQPSAGTRSALLGERAGGFLGGTVDFNRAFSAVSVYRRLAGPVTAALSGAAGWVRQFAPSRVVPIHERFFVGGGSSVRGYRERDLGPKDSAGNPLGGNVLARGSLELRFPIWKRLAGALFVDGGQVDSRAALVGPRHWKAGAGPGLRLRTPVGPVRLDFGYKINPDPGDRSRWAFHFSLGEAF